MKVAFASSLVCVALALPMSASAAQSQDLAASAIDVAAAQIEQSHQQQNRIDAAVATIKSKEALARYVAAMPKSLSPLATLSPAAQDRFLRSLTFNHKGLTSYEHADLAAELSPTQIYRILSLFGVQGTARIYGDARVASAADKAIIIREGDDDGLPGEGGDYKNHWCSSHATCTEKDGSTCITSNC